MLMPLGPSEAAGETEAEGEPGDPAGFWLLCDLTGLCTRPGGGHWCPSPCCPPRDRPPHPPSDSPVPLRVPAGRVLLPRQARCAQARPPAPRSPVRPPPLPWPRRRCSTKKGLARSVTHSALATSTSSGPSHIPRAARTGPEPVRRKRAPPPSLRPSRAERSREAGAGSRRRPEARWLPLAAALAYNAAPSGLAVSSGPATSVQFIGDHMFSVYCCSPGELMLQKASGEGLAAPGQPRNFDSSLRLESSRAQSSGTAACVL